MRVFFLYNGCMTAILVFVLFILTFILIKSADVVVISLQRLSKSNTKSGFVLAALLLALATSFPELFVGLTSALEKNTSLSLGVIVGSNIANISIIAGIAAVIAGKVYIRGEYYKKDIFLAFVAGLLPLFLSLDGSLNRVDGLILLSIYGAFVTSLFQIRFEEIGKRHLVETFIHRLFRIFNHIDFNKSKEIGRLFLGVALLLLSADTIVTISTRLAVAMNIPVFVIGVVIVAIGTSLPELAFSIKSLSDKEPKMFLGNLLGSVIVNSTLIVGLSALINPITTNSISDYGISAFYFVAIYLAFWYFIKTKLRLDRKEAVILILLYLSFLFFELR